MRTLFIACLGCASLALGWGGCGGSSSATHTASNTRAVWAAKTQQLCAQKRAAIASLGNVHITYSGIARVGLPAVKQLLDRYLARLLVVLRDFSARQQAVPAPASVRPTMVLAAQVDRQSEAATAQLRRTVGGVQTATALSAAFHGWLATLQRLAARGDAAAQQLNLPACRAGG